MTKTVTTSGYGTLPVVAFHRLHVDTKEPVEFHALIYSSPEDARAKAEWIQTQDHLALLGTTDALVDVTVSASLGNVQPPKPRSEYGKRLDAMHARIAERLRDERVVFYSAYRSDGDDLPIDNLDAIPIEGRVRFEAEGRDSCDGGRDYVSQVVESPTWLEIAVLADEMIKTTGDYHHQFLENVYVIGEVGGIQVARFSMGS